MDRHELIKRIRVAAKHELHALAAAYGYHLVDLSCTVCGYKVNYYAIQKSPHRDALPEHDYRYHVCLGCNFKGRWTHVDSPAVAKPVASAPVAQAQVKKNVSIKA